MEDDLLYVGAHCSPSSSGPDGLAVSIDDCDGSPQARAQIYVAAG
jgi:hypothetical protein